MLDSKDKKIMEILQQDASITIRALADRIDLTQTPCRERMITLTQNNYMRGPVMLLNKNKLNLHITAFVMIKMCDHYHERNEKLIADITRMPEVIEFHRTTGICDYVLQVVASDMQHYADIYAHMVKHTGEQCNITTSLSLLELKSTTHLPLSNVLDSCEH